MPLRTPRTVHREAQAAGLFSDPRKSFRMSAEEITARLDRLESARKKSSIYRDLTAILLPSIFEEGAEEDCP